MPSLLIVEDELTIRDLLLAVFGADYHCRTAASGEEAITLLQDYTFDLILADLNLPGLSGEELIGYLQQTCPESTVMVMTGNDTASAEEELQSMGVHSFIQKPFRVTEVLASVRQAAASRIVQVKTATDQTGTGPSWPMAPAIQTREV